MPLWGGGGEGGGGEGEEGEREREREREGEREGGRGRERGEHPIVTHMVLTLTSDSSDSMGRYLLVCQQETYSLAYSTPAK